MNFSEIWADDLLSFIMFLILILPLPFVYVILSNILEADAIRLSYFTFIGVALAWFFVGTLYIVLGNRGSKSDDLPDQSI